MVILFKAVTGVFWLTVLYNLLSPFESQSLSDSFNYAGFGILIAHGIEYAVFKNKIANSANPVIEAVQILLFGYAHVMSLKLNDTQ